MNLISQVKKVQDLYQVILDNGTIYNVSELMVLDFDGTQAVAYRNAELGIDIENINVAASLEADTQSAVLDQLNAQASGVFYLSAAQAAALNLPAGCCSTIYVGDTDDMDSLGGAFSGIAETTGESAAASQADNAFVLTNRIGSLEELVAAIAHEAGHLTGALAHDYGNDGATLDDFMEGTRVVIAEGQSSNIADGTVFDNLFHDEVGYAGAAIWNGGTVTIGEATFTSNTADSGGAVYNSRRIIITSATFSGNSSLSGGAILNRFGTATINGATFTGNRGNYGGAILNSSGTATITSATFTGNTAAVNGGAVYNSKCTATINGATFTGNTAAGNGGAIYTISGTATITSATFTDNTAAGNGGAICNVSGGRATITAAIFSGNRAFYGGAIYTAGRATITAATFSGNRGNYGGAIYNGGTATITSATFTGNIGGDFQVGGAVYNAGTATITSATFTGNRAGSAGAIYNAGGTATITSATFTGNTAVSAVGVSGFGGAVYNGTGTATITAATFSGNTAHHVGGAIYNVGSATITGATFTGNRARSGGAIYTSGRATIENATFTGNTATGAVGVSGFGGAVYNDGIATITSATFSGNIARDVGGAIYNVGIATITSATFTGNSANSGGAVFINGGTVTISDNVFETATDTIWNGGNLTLSGANSLGGDLTNATGGTVTFDTEAVTTLTNSAMLVNNGAAQALGGKLVVDHDATANYTSGNLVDDIMVGDWGQARGVTKIDVVVADGTTRTGVTLGGSFTDENGAKLWFGSNNGRTGITDSTLELNNANITTADADYSRFDSLASLNATYEDFNGVINVTGGNYSENLYGGNADLLFDTAASTASSKLVVGGFADGATSQDSTITINSAVSAGSVIGGNQYRKEAVLSADVAFTMDCTVAIASASAFSQFIVGGSLLNDNDGSAESYKFTDSGAKGITLTGNASAKIVTGGSIVGNKSKLEDAGDTSVTISAGSYTFVDGAGYIQNEGTATLAKSGTTTVTVTGGTCDYIYGGVGGNKYTYVSRSTVTGAVSVNIDASAGAITVKSIFGGCSGKATGFTADTTVTFKGEGANLTFASKTGLVAGGNARNDVEDTPATGTSGKNTLAFDGFSGAFGAPKVRDFDTATFTGSTMSFANALDLSAVETWNFDGESQLTWNDGRNDFGNDTLNFTGFEVGETDVILSDGVDLFGNLSDAAYVNINGVAAELNGDKWVAGSNTLSVSGNKLVVTIAA